MEYSDAFKVFIRTDNSIICCYNEKTRLISSYAYYDGNEFCDKQDISMRDFIPFLESFYDVKLDIAQINESINKLLSDSDYFSFPYLGKDSKGNPIKINFKGGWIDDDNIAVAIIKEKEKTINSVDELTKCVSSDLIREKANFLLKKKKKFILGVIDIDNFDDVNQKYGTVIGDIILIELATITKDIIKGKGLISRIGGDAFLFYYETSGDYDEVRSFVLQIKDRIKTSINEALNIDKKITITLGISRAFTDSDDFVVLYNMALKALERGKKKSKDCFIIYFEDKCGTVDNIDRVNDTHFVENKIAGYSAISAAVEVLNSNLLFSRRVEETLGLIGTFFMLDRITLVEYENDNQVKEFRVWNNPSSPKKPITKTTSEELLLARSFLGKSNLYVCDDAFHIENEKLKDCLMNSSTYAIIASELRQDNRFFGLIKYEMTTHTRAWQKEDVIALSILTKLISTKYNKEYDLYNHFKQMYFDSETDLFNLHKWYEDVTTILEGKNENIKVDKFIVLDIGINDYNSLVSISGIKSLRKILKTIAESFKGLEDLGIIYCRSYENRFTLFIPNDDTFLVKNVFKRVINALETLGKDEFDRTSLRGGYYVADVATNKLSFDEIVERAVIARKKSNSTENILEFNEEMLVIDKFRTMLISHIDAALENNEFLVYLQPKISTKTGLVGGAEALSRWNYNFEKLIFPNDFIPILEDNGYIAKLDYNVFENVCVFIKKLEAEGKTPIPISVNVSRSIKDFDAYFNKLEKIRNKYDVDPKYIEIEITEGMYSRDNEEIEIFIDKLHKVGYNVSMDDFGSGNSNISTLSQLTFDTIKFDRGFFKNIDNEKEKMIIDSMTRLVKGMNMTVVCEGIETEEYVKYLTKIGADFIQGYYFDKPIVISDFEKKYIQ